MFYWQITWIHYIQGSFCVCIQPMTPSQWEAMLHCNVVFHWLGAYTKWSLYILYNMHPDDKFDFDFFVVNVSSGLGGFRKVWKFPVESMYLSGRNVPLMNQVVIMWLTWGTAGDIPHVDDNVSLIFKDYKLNFDNDLHHYLRLPFIYCEIPLNYTGWHLLDYGGSFTSAHPQSSK